MAETKPIPTRNPSNAALAKGVNALHACHEVTQTKVIGLEQGQVKMQTQMAHLQGVVDGIAIGMGLPSSAQLAAGAPTSQPAKVVARWDVKTWASIIGATGGLLLLLQVLNAVVPVAWRALMGLAH